MEPGVSGFKTNRPYTSYELKSIRDQLQDRADDRYLDVYSTPRPTGGTYTMVDPLKHLRNNRNTAVSYQQSLYNQFNIYWDIFSIIILLYFVCEIRSCALNTKIIRVKKYLDYKKINR